MLFDHRVRPVWMDRIPAVVHLDGTARLQTVGPQEPVLTRVLGAYKRASGIPVLCNTSANFRGRGFFRIWIRQFDGDRSTGSGASVGCTGVRSGIDRRLPAAAQESASSCYVTECSHVHASA